MVSQRRLGTPLLLLLLLWAAARGHLLNSSERFKKCSVLWGSMLAEHSGLHRLRCAALCGRRPDCAHWRHNPTTGACSLWEEAGSDQLTTAVHTAYDRYPPFGYSMGPDRIAYRLVRENRLWSSLPDGCRRTHHRAKPAVPISDASMTLLKEFYNTMRYHMYIGLRCTSGTQYVDAEDQVVTVQGSWFSNGVVPSCSTTSSSNCAAVDANGIHLHSCTHQHMFVCEIQNAVPHNCQAP